jgi:hypothetical protein
LDGFGNVAERATLTRELVRHADGRTGLDLALDDTARFQILEPRGEHFGSKAGRAVSQLTEPARAGLQGSQYHRCPRVAENLDGRLKGTTLTID